MSDPSVSGSLSGAVVSGARWIGLMRVTSMATAWITAIALARLLDPSQYGLAGMALVLISILTVFQESGLHAALVQRQHRVQEAVDVASVYAPAVGLLLGAACLAAAPLAGLFFHRHQVTDLVRLLSVVFVLRGISQVPIAIVQKELRYRPFVVVTIGATLLQTAVAIALAAAGAGAWSAIGGLIALETVQALLMWPICPMRPHVRRAKLETLRELLRFGRNMVGAGINSIIYSYVDIAVIGRFLGPASLGAYTIGYQTGKQPVANVTVVTNQVIFPAYAKIQTEPERFRRAYLRSLEFITIVSVPIAFWFALLSEQFVRCVYGDRWSAAAPVLTIMALMGLVLSVTATTGEVMKAVNRPGLFFRISLFETVLVVILVLALYRFGIAAVAGGVAGSVTAAGVVAIVVTGRILGLAARDWLSALWPSLAAGGVMVAVLAVTNRALGAIVDTAQPEILLLLIVVGAAVYFAALAVISRDRLRVFIREVDTLAPILRARSFLLRRRSSVGAVEPSGD